MDHFQFEALLPIISSDLVNRIAIAQNISEREAIINLYKSSLYEMLEREDTKVWQYSGELLLELYFEEQETGNINFPEM